MSARRQLRPLVAMLAAIAVWSMVPAIAHAAFPGTNGKLAFGSARNGFPSDNDLYTMDPNGAAQTPITSLPLDELNPSWSPYGTEVVFERSNGLPSDIWIANANGTNARPLTTHPGNDTRPAFSNTAAKIVFASDRNSTPGTSDLFVMDATPGANPVAITNTPTVDEDYPAWSPDGTWIAFSRDGDIYKISPSGVSLTRLTTSAITEFEPDWSPSGSEIVFRQGINGDDELWKVGANGGAPTALAHNGSIPEEHPVWSPQGDKIAFVRGMFNEAEVFTMNADGSGVTRVTNNTFMDASPSWRVIPIATPAPETTITSGPPATSSDNTPTFAFTTNQAGSTFECLLDGGAFTPCGSPFTAPALADGPHTFDVRAIGPAGNPDPTPARISFTVAGSAPPGPGPSAPAGGTGAGASGTAVPAASAPAPAVKGASSAGAVTVSRTGSFALKKHSVECPAGGSSCTAKSSVTGSVTASAKKKKVKLGGSSYILAAGKKGTVKVKLTKKGVRLLRRSKRVKATVTITVTKGAKVTTKTVRVTLRAPSKK